MKESANYTEIDSLLRKICTFLQDEMQIKVTYSKKSKFGVIIDYLFKQKQRIVQDFDTMCEEKKIIEKFFPNNLDEQLSEVIETVIDELDPDRDDFVFDVENNPFILYYADIVRTHVLFRLFKMSIIEESITSKYSDLIKPETLFYGQEEQPDSGLYVHWFRGQTNKDWSLLPSFYRGETKRGIIDSNLILDRYASRPATHSITEKLKKVGLFCLPGSLGYEVSAFVQHSMAYSPLLDFTKEASIALSFSFSNLDNFSSFYSTAPAIIVLTIKKDEIVDNQVEADSILRNLWVSFYTKKVGLTILLRDTLWCSLVLGEEHSALHPIDIQTNDRMKFQQGTFVIPDRVIIVGDKVFFSPSTKGTPFFMLRKIVIDMNAKDQICKENLEANPQYHCRYLYNPYLFMSDRY